MYTYKNTYTYVYINIVWTHESCHMNGSYVHIFTYSNICIHTYMSTYEYIYTYVYTYIVWTHELCHMNESYIHMYTFICMCIYTCMSTYKYIYTYVYIYIVWTHESCHTNESWHMNESCHMNESWPHKRVMAYERVMAHVPYTQTMAGLHRKSICRHAIPQQDPCLWRHANSTRYARYWRFYICDVTRAYVWRDSFMRVSWHIHVCDVTQSVLAVLTTGGFIYTHSRV